MKHIVSFSGGAGSFVAAMRVKEMYGVDNMQLLFADALIEDADLYRFLKEAAAYIGAPLVRIADGRNPWQVFEDVKFIGNSRIDPCSKHLKRDLIARYLAETFDPAEVTIYTGIGWWEPTRIEKIARNLKKYKSPWRYEHPLTAEPHLDPREVLEQLDAAGIARPRLYGMGFTHNNCGGFCIKAGHASFALLLHNMPHLYMMHEYEENRLRAKGINGTILSDRRGDNKKKPLTMTAFRLRLEKDAADFDPNDVGGCGCAGPA